MPDPRAYPRVDFEGGEFNYQSRGLHSSGMLRCATW